MATLLRAVISCDAGRFNNSGGPILCDQFLLSADSEYAVKAAIDSHGWLQTPRYDLCPKHRGLVDK